MRCTRDLGIFHLLRPVLTSTRNALWKGNWTYAFPQRVAVTNGGAQTRVNRHIYI